MAEIDRTALLAGLRQMVREESQRTAQAATQAATRAAMLLPEIQAEIEEAVHRMTGRSRSIDADPAAREEWVLRLALQVLGAGKAGAERMEKEILEALAGELERLREIAVTLDRVHLHLAGVREETPLSVWLAGFGARHQPGPGSAYGAGWLTAGLGLVRLTAALPEPQDGDPGSHRRAVLDLVGRHFREDRSRVEEEISGRVHHLFAQVRCGIDVWLDRMAQEPEGPGA